MKIVNYNKCWLWNEVNDYVNRHFPNFEWKKDYFGKWMVVFNKKIVGLFDNKTKATLTLFDKNKWVEE